MLDRLPFGGNNAPSKANSPRRMLYQQASFTLPAGGSHLTALEWDLRVGKITQEEYDAKQKEVAALNPSKEMAVVMMPRFR